jgi:hypothetical protein
MTSTVVVPLASARETLHQYTERRVREIASEYSLTQAEVRRLYDWYAEWWGAVLTAVESGQVLPARTLNALERYHRYRVAHDYPAAVPIGYVLPD